MLRAAWKSLLGRKVRLVMSTFAIVLGVGFAAGTLIFSDTLDRSFTAIFASSVGDVVVESAEETPEDTTPAVTIPADLVQELEEAVPGAARVDGNVSALGVHVIDVDGRPVGGQGAPAMGLSWSDAPAGHGIAGLVIEEGREPDGRGEVVLDEYTAEQSGYELGDTVTLETAQPEVPVIEAELVGTAAYGEGGSLGGATMAIFDTDTAQQLFLGGEDAFHDLWVTAEEGVTQAELRDRVARELPDGLEAQTGDDRADESASDLLDALSFITIFLMIFAVIALVVGTFLIVNTFSILVAQRSRELALLRALGASGRQVRGTVLFEALVLGLVGATAGLGVGVLLFLAIRAVMGRAGLDLSSAPMVFEATTVLAAYAVGVLVTMLAAWIPARRTSRIPPVAALRDDVAMPESSLRRRLVLGALLVVLGVTGQLLSLFTDVPYGGYLLGVGTLAVLLGVAAASAVLAMPFLRLARRAYRRLFGSVGNLAGQNAMRNPRRTAATSSALMIGLTLCVTLAILGASAKASVDEAIADNFVGDYVVSNVMGVPFSAAVAERAAAVDGVAEINRVRLQYLPEEGRSAFVGVAPDTLVDGLRVDVVAGSLDALGDSTVMISRDQSDDRDLGVGDTVALDLPAGEQEFEVVAIYDDHPVLGSSWVVDLAAFGDAGFPPQDNFVFVTVASGADREVVRSELREATSDLRMVTVKDQAGLAEEQRGPIDQVLLLIYGLLALALVIAVLGIVNTLALSVIERTREVGLLRAIGLSRSQLRTMIRLESVVIASLGALVGTGLGLVFGRMLLASLAGQGLEAVVIPWGQLAAFLLAALVVGVLAAVLPARRAARLDVLDAIATE